MSIMLENPNPQISTDQLVSLNRSKIKPLISGLNDESENGLVLNPCSSSSSSSSSIGVNSDDDLRNNNHDDDDDDDDDEVESKLKISPFDSAADALEQALPIRRGISNFYSGKSKSFASLSDVAYSSVKDITKSENAYSRKRKNLLAFSLYDKSRTPLPKCPGVKGSEPKMSSNTTTPASAFEVGSNDHETHTDESEGNTRKNSRIPTLPPVTPVPWRSFSVADLQHCAVSAGALNSKVSNLRPALIGKRSKLDEVS